MMLSVDEINQRIPLTEPWGVFDSWGSMSGPLQVQKLDDPDAADLDDVEVEPYENETDAWEALWIHVLAGDEIGLGTLYWLLQENPVEARRIIVWNCLHCEIDVPEHYYGGVDDHEG